VSFSRVPIRVRLTAAFALATVVVLAGVALFVYVRLRADLDEGVNASLNTRVTAVAAAARRGDVPPAAAGGGQPEESFAQVLALDGRLLDASGGVRGAVLSASELRRAARSAVVVERRVPGIEGTARLLARPASYRTAPAVVLAGQSLDDRNVTLSGLIASFAIGGPLAVVLASLIGYGLAAAGLAPMEAMRRRAAQVSLAGDDDRLPLPAARDEVRRLGETLNDMLERLRRSFERERSFVADASHELRTPVAVLKIELEGALRTGDYGPEVREALIAAIEECDHLAQLAEDLLVIARAGEGQLPVRREALTARPILEAVRARFADRAGQRGRRISVAANDDVHLRADVVRLGQALGNLVDNALRHGGGDIVLSARRAGGGVAFDAADSGAGFPREVAGRAFERFARGDEARTRDGTGLGLAIVRAVAEAHGGRATIVGGRGTTVRIWLPDDEAPALQPDLL
jgi:two-component system OmpR family sensor kinase